MIINTFGRLDIIAWNYATLIVPSLLFMASHLDDELLLVDVSMTIHTSQEHLEGHALMGRR